MHKYKKYSDDIDKIRKIYKKTSKLFTEIKKKQPKSPRKKGSEEKKKSVKFNETVMVK